MCLTEYDLYADVIGTPNFSSRYFKNAIRDFVSIKSAATLLFIANFPDCASFNPSPV